MVTKLEQMVLNHIEMCNNDKHGYSQVNRNGPDYDCSSSIYWAMKNAGMEVTSTAWSTHSMVDALSKRGWEIAARNVKTSANLLRGDILLNPGSHTELYIGGGKMSGFNKDENGGIKGVLPGDQTGKEAYVKPFNASSKGQWAYVMRFKAERATGTTTASPTVTPTTSGAGVLKLGSKGPETKKLQEGLNRCFPAYSKLVADSDFGPKTEAVVKEFQRRCNLTVDGIVDAQTRQALQRFGIL